MAWIGTREMCGLTPLLRRSWDDQSLSTQNLLGTSRNQTGTSGNQSTGHAHCRLSLIRPSSSFDRRPRVSICWKEGPLHARGLYLRLSLTSERTHPDSTRPQPPSARASLTITLQVATRAWSKSLEIRSRLSSSFSPVWSGSRYLPMSLASRPASVRANDAPTEPWALMATGWAASPMRITRPGWKFGEVYDSGCSSAVS
ncbi:uncharacterized protein BJ171DRAFT_207413 [Polychytrium aggregatum]|uniref:uncharacterized protein n=1 Tax=Polychytrium aggregatum TaxID=110093 RepID=UPI0022FE1F55|nr:uncharacterized protein BJ171DRAFT_207413 [Polychytrium aggregatum]KAI9208429.1 hypothetical protein BJ171DRAFT_207413 [Polychytrium aggregatum]